MKEGIELNKIKVVTISLIGLGVVLAGTIIINGFQLNLLFTMAIGYATALINFFLLPVFVYLAFEVQKPLMAFALELTRLAIFGVSGWLAIKTTEQGIYWVLGLLAVQAGVIIANVKPNNKKGGVI